MMSMNPENFGDQDILIGFFGGTGSGKSSVIKALLGEDHLDFAGIVAGNAAGTTSRSVAIEWKKTASGHKVWLVDVSGEGQPTRSYVQEARQIQAEIDAVYPRVHLAVSVIRGMQAQRQYQDWNDHVRRTFPRERHVVLFNGQKSDPTAAQWPKEVFEQEFDRLKSTYTRPLEAGESPSNEWYCDVPGYDCRCGPEQAPEIRRRSSDIEGVRAELLAFATDHGPAAVAERAPRCRRGAVMVQVGAGGLAGGLAGVTAGVALTALSVTFAAPAGVALGVGFVGIRCRRAFV